jgi:polysaccharide biosynthesis protein PslA
MSQAAFKRAGAELDQARARLGTPVTVAEPSAEAREARRMAALAGEFCLFGLSIALDESRLAEPADQAYRPVDEIQPAPANDTDPPPDARVSPGFPHLPQRGVHLHPGLPVRALQVIDWLFIIVAAETAALWGAGLGLAELPLGAAATFIAAAGSLKLGLWITDSYRVTPARMRAERSIGGLALGAIAGLAVTAAFAPDARSAAALAATLPIAAILLAGVHAALALLTRAAHRAGVFSETIVLIGATEAAARVVQRLSRSGEARVIAVADDRSSRAPQQLGSAPVAGNLEELLAWDGLANVDRMVITVTPKAEARVRDIIQRLRVAPNRIDFLLDVDAFAVRGKGAQRFAGVALACVSGRPHSAARAILKRAQDLLLASLLLIACALPMLVIALAVKLDSAGPALYRQRRYGFNNRIITLLRFRSMRRDPGAAPQPTTSPDDSRITRVGRFLRRTSLDELPQLINVLKGDMSLVGPRPHAVGLKAAERDLQDIVADYAHRHRVKPGITGWAQINGSRGPVETTAAARRRLRYDLEYVARASLWLDFHILLRTVQMLFGGEESTQ